jgi:hypothetical protein
LSLPWQYHRQLHPISAVRGLFGESFLVVVFSRLVVIGLLAENINISHRDNLQFFPIKRNISIHPGMVAAAL